MKKFIRNWLGIVLIFLTSATLIVLKTFKIIFITWNMCLLPLYIWVIVLLLTPFLIKWMVDNDIKKQKEEQDGSI